MVVLTTHPINTIVSSPDIRGGKPVIRGTGIRVIDIVLAHTTGDKLTPETLAAHYQLSIGDVHAALAYYYDHQPEMDADIQRDKEEAERLAANLEAQGKLKRLE